MHNYFLETYSSSSHGMSCSVVEEDDISHNLLRGILNFKFNFLYFSISSNKNEPSPKPIKYNVFHSI